MLIFSDITDTKRRLGFVNENCKSTERNPVESNVFFVTRARWEYCIIQEPALVKAELSSLELAIALGSVPVHRRTTAYQTITPGLIT